MLLSAWRAVLLTTLGAGAFIGACGGSTSDANDTEAPDGGESGPDCTVTSTSIRPGGFSECSDQSVHRAFVESCPSRLDTFAPPSGSDSMTVKCQSHADCTAQPNGYCGSVAPTVSAMGGSVDCVYGCLQDSDCPADNICVCGNPVGRCIEASACQSDADCDDGTPCFVLYRQSGCGTVAYTRCGVQCRTDDDCSSPATCEKGACKAKGPDCRL